ncbi:MAG: hypothetical protein EXS50_01175 [Candidatus Taylorbacteria bacterium]|nr:hypothetical protein [Candidatus Taylorbacteria bacterium]
MASEKEIPVLAGKIGSDLHLVEIVKSRRTTSVGGMTTNELVVAIKGVKEKNEIAIEAMFIIDKIVSAQKKEQIDHIILTVRDLGFTSNTRTDAFMTKKFCAEWSAKHLDGYIIEICEPEDGLQLRLQYQDQPKGETLWVAMERIADFLGYHNVFCVRRDGSGSRWLNVYWVFENGLWPLDYLLMFRLRKIV